MEEVIRQYINLAFILQVATTSNNKPWVCNVYFVGDESLNIYWLSLPSRRHSLEISVNPNVAVTMGIKTDQPVIGLGAEGTAEEITDIKTIEPLIKKYIDKYDSGREFLPRLKKGKNDHVMYKFTPKKFVLFDEQNFAESGSKDWIPRPNEY